MKTRRFLVAAAVGILPCLLQATAHADTGTSKWVSVGVSGTGGTLSVIATVCQVTGDGYHDVYGLEPCWFPNLDSSDPDYYTDEGAEAGVDAEPSDRDGAGNHASYSGEARYVVTNSSSSSTATSVVGTYAFEANNTLGESQPGYGDYAAWVENHFYFNDIDAETGDEWWHGVDVDASVRIYVDARPQYPYDPTSITIGSLAPSSSYELDGSVSGDIESYPTSIS